ncbi:ligand-binding sensor domain-containing protein [Nibrella saemangeumensis]|uniref:ligand-binding sensor domain-containing protein n=1 Tax=Nibrella saemangeumensis TaxID=1084526 RepID=UPI0031E60F8E
MRTFFMLLVAGGLISSCLWAQPARLPFEFNHIQEQQGLSFNQINCFFQDRDGYFWVGTMNGLNRFDGNSFTVFKHNPADSNSIGHNSVYSICQDREGHIWLGTGKGISQFNHESGRFINFKRVNGQLLEECVNILCDRTGDIWFSQRGRGLCRYQVTAKRFADFKADTSRAWGLASNYISRVGLVEDPHRNGIWMTTLDRGIHYYDKATGRFHNARYNPDKLPIFNNHFTSSLGVDQQGRVMYADNYDERIVLFDTKNRTIADTIGLRTPTGTSPFPIAALLMDRSGNLWVSSRNRAIYYRDARTHRTTEIAYNEDHKTSPADKYFIAAWQHPDGSVWLGTTNGISYTNPEKAFYRIHNIGALFPGVNANRGINCIVEDEDGSWWLSTASQEVMHYYPATAQLKVYKIPSAQPDEGGFGHPVLGFSKDRRKLFVAMSTELWVFDKKSLTFSQLPSAGTLIKRLNGVSAMLVQDDDLWLFGSRQLGSIRYHIPSSTWKEVPMPYKSKDQTKAFVRTVMTDTSNTLWLDVFPDGFARFSSQEGKFLAVTPRNAIEYEENFFFFKIDRHNQLWMPVNGYGLVRYDPRTNTYRLWTEHDGLGANMVQAVCPDRYGKIWISAYNKFSVFNPVNNQFRNFSIPVFPEGSYYENYMFSLRNGNILSTLKGYVVEFMPDRINAKSPPAKVLISSLVLPDTHRLVYAGMPTVDLDVDDRTFSINYSVMTVPQRNYKYLYKLDGYDDKWIEAGSRTVANYTRIPGGNYTFRVKAVAAEVETPETTLAVHVNTEFYNMFWFRALLGLGLVGLIILFYRYRTQQTKQVHHLQVQATRLERDKTAMQYQNLINHLNPHFLFNSLTSLNSLIITEPKQASRFLQKLSAIYRYILQNKEKETVSLEHELTFVNHYIDLQKSRFEEGLQINIDVPEQYMSSHIVPVTLQNLFENAIKHNIIDDENPLVIRVYIDNEYLCVANTLQKKHFVETSNQQGLDSLKSLYSYLSDRPISIAEEEDQFIVKLPLL